MPQLHRSARLLLILVCFVVPAVPTHAAATPYQTAWTRWRAAEGGFGSWTLAGVAIATDGALTLDPANAAAGTDPYPAGGYHGRNFYNGGAFVVGEATSPEVTTNINFTQAIASWNAYTPPGTWIETRISARIGQQWTKWYNLGVWAADSSTVERHSVNQQGDAHGYVAVDTLVLSAKKASANAFQLNVRLFRANGSSATPTLRNASVAASKTPAKPSTLAAGDPTRWNIHLPVPQCSQMVYPDGGEVWCSPTSTSMVLAYWQQATGPCEPRVRAAVVGTYDWLYAGYGNWPFNTAYAATQGLEGYVARFTSLAQVEAWVAAGVPVVVSYAWKKGALTGAPIPSSNGHLAVVVGFDSQGNPIVNDPAAGSDTTVERIYNRAEFESLWLEHSGGTVYLIHPTDHSVPMDVLP